MPVRDRNAYQREAVEPTGDASAVYMLTSASVIRST